MKMKRLGLQQREISVLFFTKLRKIEMNLTNIQYFDPTIWPKNTFFQVSGDWLTDSNKIIK